jgi:acyl dehydratase
MPDTTLDESAVGMTSAPQDFEVEKGAIRRFAEAIGDTNPLYLDVAFARAHGYANVIAPPTFPTTFRVPLPVTIDPSHVLHGEQDYTFSRPITAGETIRCVSKILKVYARDGSLGKMTFVIAEISGQDAQGQPVFTGKSTIIVH